MQGREDVISGGTGAYTLYFRAQKALKSLTHTTFGVVHALRSQARPEPIGAWAAWALLLASCFQRMSYAVDPRFWEGSHLADAAHSFFSFFTHRFWALSLGDGAVSWLLRLAYCSTFFMLADALYVAHCFHRNDFFFSWQVRSLRWLARGINTVLALPMVALLSVANCPAASTDALCAAEDISTADRVLATLALVLFVPMALVARALLVENDVGKSPGVLDKAHTRLDVAALVFDAVLAMSFAFVPPTGRAHANGYLAALLFVGGAALAFGQLALLPFRLRKPNEVMTGLGFVVAGTGFMALLATAAQGRQGAAGAREALAVVLLLGWFLFYKGGRRLAAWSCNFYYSSPAARVHTDAAATIAKLQRRFGQHPMTLGLLRSKVQASPSLRASITDRAGSVSAPGNAENAYSAPKTAPAVAQLAMLLGADGQSASVSASGVPLLPEARSSAERAAVIELPRLDTGDLEAPAMDEQVNMRGADQLPSSSPASPVAAAAANALRGDEEAPAAAAAAAAAEPDQFPQLAAANDDDRESAAAWFPTAYHVELNTRFMVAGGSAVGEEAALLALALLELGSELFPESALLSLQQATLLLRGSVDNKAKGEQVIGAMEEGKRHRDMELDVAFGVFAHQQEIRKSAAGKADSTGHHANEVNEKEMQRAIGLCKDEYNSVVNKLTDFWGLLLRDEVHLQSLDALMKEIMTAQRRATFLYSTLLERYPNSPAVQRAYARFLAAVKNQPDSAKSMFDKADLLEEQQSRQRGALAAGAAAAERTSGSQRASVPDITCESSPRGILRLKSKRAQGSPRPLSPATAAAEAAGGADASRLLRFDFAAPSSQPLSPVDAGHVNSLKFGVGTGEGGAGAVEEEDDEKSGRPRHASLTVPLPEETRRAVRAAMASREVDSGDNEEQVEEAAEKEVEAVATSGAVELSDAAADAEHAAAPQVERPEDSIVKPQIVARAEDKRSPSEDGSSHSGGSSLASATVESRLRSRWPSIVANAAKTQETSAGLKRLRQLVYGSIVLLAAIGCTSYLIIASTFYTVRDNASSQIIAAEVLMDAGKAIRLVRSLDVRLRYRNASNNPMAYAGTGNMSIDLLYPPHWFRPWPGGWEQFDSAFEQSTRAGITTLARALASNFDRILYKPVLRPNTLRKLEAKLYSGAAPIESTGALVPQKLNIYSLTTGYVTNLMRVAQVDFDAWAASQATVNVFPRTRSRALNGQQNYEWLIWNDGVTPYISFLDLLNIDVVTNHRNLIISGTLSFLLTFTVVVILTWFSLRNGVNFVSREKFSTLSAFVEIPRSVAFNVTEFYRREKESDIEETAATMDDEAAGAANGTSSAATASAAAAAAGDKADAVKLDFSAVGAGGPSAEEPASPSRKSRAPRKRRQRKAIWEESRSVSRMHIRYALAYAAIVALNVAILASAVHYSSKIQEVRDQLNLVINRNFYTTFFAYFTLTVPTRSNYNFGDTMNPAILANPGYAAFVHPSLLESIKAWHGNVTFGGSQIAQGTFQHNAELDAFMFSDMCVHPLMDCSSFDQATRDLASQGFHAAVMAYFSAGDGFCRGFSPVLGMNDPSVRQLEKMHGPSGIVTQGNRVSRLILEDRIQSLTSAAVNVELALFVTILASLVLLYFLVLHPMLSLLEEEGKHSRLMFLMIPIDALATMPRILRLIGINPLHLGLTDALQKEAEDEHKSSDSEEEDEAGSGEQKERDQQQGGGAVSNSPSILAADRKLFSVRRPRSALAALFLCLALGIAVYAFVAFSVEPRGVDTAATIRAQPLLVFLSVLDGLFSGLAPTGLGTLSQFAAYDMLGETADKADVSAWLRVAQLVVAAPVLLWLLVCNFPIDWRLVGVGLASSSLPMFALHAGIEEYFVPDPYTHELLVVLWASTILGLALGMLSFLWARRMEGVPLPFRARLMHFSARAVPEILLCGSYCGVIDTLVGSGAVPLMALMSVIYFDLDIRVAMGSCVAYSFGVGALSTLAHVVIGGTPFFKPSLSLLLATTPFMMAGAAVGLAVLLFAFRATSGVLAKGSRASNMDAASAQKSFLLALAAFTVLALSFFVAAANRFMKGADEQGTMVYASVIVVLVFGFTSGLISIAGILRIKAIEVAEGREVQQHTAV